jgi:hypothetical protein
MLYLRMQTESREHAKVKEMEGRAKARQSHGRAIGDTSAARRLSLRLELS